jgi:hypothetical protein
MSCFKSVVREFKLLYPYKASSKIKLLKIILKFTVVYKKIVPSTLKKVKSAFSSIKELFGLERTEQ